MIDTTKKVLAFSRTRHEEDYTEEICRCMDFIALQLERGWNIEEVYNQASGHYHWYIATEAIEALRRNIK